LIAQHSIQEVLNRIDIIDVVGEFVKLKRRGNSHLGLCPFHNEKTPSFTVSQTKELYKCFGCGRSGNTIGFLMEHEKYSYVEAIRWLATRYNVELEETETSPEQRQRAQLSESLFILNKFARDYFSKQLLETEKGRDIALSYLHERGFSEETINTFQLGYCPDDRDGFSRAALQAQFNPEILQKSGLSVIRDDKPIDNYRGRIIFPIHNQSGKIIGFGARIIAKNDRAPKYINTPENDLYVKSRILYGSYFARHAIDKQDECLLVEGYTDVISLYQAGVENVVASGGTSLTVDQLRLIKKYTSNLTIIYDGDRAGIKAALRGIDLALEEGLNVKLVLVPDGEDPDSYVRKSGGEAFREYIRHNRKDVILFQLEVSMEEVGDDSQKKAALVNQIAESISHLNKAEDFTRQQDYIQRSSALLKIDEQGLTNLVNKFIRDRQQKEEKRTNRQTEQDAPPPHPEDASGTENTNLTTFLQGDEAHERGVVRSLVEFGLKPWDDDMTVAEFILRDMDENGLTEMIENKNLVRLIQAYRTEYEHGNEPTARQFLYHQDPILSQLTVSIMDTTHEISPRWKEKLDVEPPSREDLYKPEVESCMNYLKIRKIRRMIQENQKDMEKATSEEEMLILLNTHQHLKQMEIDITRTKGTVIIK
jgi:DNA primase